jgi:hypothetical protein
MHLNPIQGNALLADLRGIALGWIHMCPSFCEPFELQWPPPLSTLVDGPSISLGGMGQRGNLLHMEFSNARCYCNLRVSTYMYAFNMRYGHILLLQLVECGISQEILEIGFSFRNASMEHEPKRWKKKSITMIPRIDSRESSNLDCVVYLLICTLYSLEIVCPDQLLIVSCSPLSAHKVP